MPHVRHLLSDRDQTEIERAVAEAESASSAEIVVALSGRSSRYQRASDLFGLTLALLAVAAAWILWQRFIPDSRDWATGTAPAIGLGWVLLIAAAWFIIGAAAADCWPTLARPFMTRAERLAAVCRRGTEAFHSLRIAKTRAATGLLIYVSLFERTVWVCPDAAIAEKLGAHEAVWKPLSDLIADGFKRGAPGPALADAVRKAGRMLAPAFPRDATDTNELDNRIRTLADERG
jgi:putative membrane protein